MGNIAKNVTLRLAEATDMAVIADLGMQALAYSKRPMGLNDCMTAEEYRDKMVADGPGGANFFGCILAEQAGKIVGFVQFTQGYDFKILGPDARVDELFVIPDLHRQKIGIRLMISLAKLANNAGWQSIYWNVDRLDIDARVFFDMMAPDCFKLNRLVYSIEEAEISTLAARG